jgi:hypothetical protein
MKHWLDQDVIQHRIKLLDEIIGILTAFDWNDEEKVRGEGGVSSDE